MEDHNKTKGELISELVALRAQVAELEALESEHKQTDRARQRQEDHQIIFDSVPAMIWYKDKNNKILRCNLTAAQIRGVAVSEMEGRYTEEFYPDEAAKYLADDLEVINSGK